MSEITSFLDWFDGFCENLTKQPTPKQWARVVDRINQLRALEPTKTISSEALRAAEEARAMAPKPQPKAKPTTQSQWISQYTSALETLGVDPESARDFAESARKMGVDISRDPMEMAHQELGGSIQ